MFVLILKVPFSDVLQGELKGKPTFRADLISLAQSRPFNLLVSLIWSMFSVPKRLTFYFQVQTGQLSAVFRSGLLGIGPLEPGAR